MTQEELFSPLTLNQLDSLSREDINSFVEAQARVIEDLSRELMLIKVRREELKQTTLEVDDEYITIKGKVVTSSSSQENEKKASKKKKKQKVQLPSERYPEAEIIEQEVSFTQAPSCGLCGEAMEPSGMHEVSEYLTVTPAVFQVIRQKREKCRCKSCHGDLKTAPSPPRICPGGAYSDNMIIDVVVSKYCDLIPIERYAAMAGRSGLIDLPPQSLIQLTHYLADFVKPVYDKIREEILASRVLHADETPHRMLEESGYTKSGKLKAWYLWGFSDNKGSSYFEIRNTRSGDVASELLKESDCEFLVSDVFSGYNKAVRETNVYRKANDKLLIENVYCNAHAYRKFRDLDNEDFKDVCLLYKKIYRLEGIALRRPTAERLLKVRSKMNNLFEQIKQKSLERLTSYSAKSGPAKAMKYFLKNYDSLTLFIGHAEVPIDNNPQERQLRNPVIGRKTWYGNHSLKGARTTAILFSIVESCKLAGVNPREYFKQLVSDLHRGKEPYSPKEYAQLMADKVAV